MSGVPARVLVVALRRRGDVLLTTPLIRSLKRAWPAAAIDALVFDGTQGILAGNSDLADVIALPQRPGATASAALLRTMWRRYDVAISTQSGDRPTLYTWAAARRSIGFVEGEGLSARLKRRALTYPVELRRDTHRVPEVLRLLEPLGLAGVAEVVAPAGASTNVKGEDSGVVAEPVERGLPTNVLMIDESVAI